MIPEVFSAKKHKTSSENLFLKKLLELPSDFKKYRSLEFPPILVCEHSVLGSSRVDIIIGF